MSDFNWSSTETSYEIIEAIHYVARDPIRCWTDPTDAELLAIFERVTKNGLLDPTDFCWGASGNRWAYNV